MHADLAVAQEIRQIKAVDSVNPSFQKQYLRIE